MHLRLLDRLNERADRSPDAPAVLESGVEAGRAFTYAQLRGSVSALATRLAKSELFPGSAVLLGAPNQAEFIVAFLGVLAAGMRIFPVSPELTAHELTSAIARSNAAGVIGSPHVINALGSSVPFCLPIDTLLSESSDAGAWESPDSAGLLLQSSGTTGRPKIVLRSAASLDAVAAQMVDAIGWQPDDHGLAVVPLCHSYGMEHGLLCPIWAGSAVHLCRGFDLRVVRRELAERGITVLPGVPFMFEMLAQHAGNAALGVLRRAYCAGGALPASVFNAMREKFSVTVSQLYGATEIGSVTFSDPNRDGFDPASVGRAMRDVYIRILDIDHPQIELTRPAGEAGQVVIRAASMLSDYINDDETTAGSMLDGYFFTGDLGKLDDFGNLTITGRLKLLIDIGGLKVNPIEVEEAIAWHPLVDACVVVPVRVSETVNRLKAIVTPRDSNAPPTADALRRFARERLVAYKVPRVFEVRPSLPKSATGKILRQLVEP